MGARRDVTLSPASPEWHKGAHAKQAKRRRLNGMSGSVEFTTWVALAGAAILAGLCWIFTSSLFVLLPAALVGAALGYWAEGVCRRWLSRRVT